MNITPTTKAVLVGAGIAAAAGIGSIIATNKYMDTHPTGSAGDGAALLANGGLALAGIGVAAAAHLRGGGPLQWGLAGGLIAGAAVGQLGFSISHGVGVDTEVSNVFSRYNQNPFDDELDLDYSPWRYPENIRYTDTEREDSYGYKYIDRDWYSIVPFTHRANTNGDEVVTRPEATTLVKSFDHDRNGRLQGSEKSQYDREVGERREWTWDFDYQWW